MPSEDIKTAYSEEAYHSYIENTKRIVDYDISQIMSKVDDLGLAEKIKYVLRTRGKRLRPIMVILSTQSVGGRLETVRKLALAIEMLHVATLIHDDILDQDILRRNELTANIKWGVREAILVGDVLASFALNLSTDYGCEIVKIISKTCVMLSDGEYLDVKNVIDTQKEGDIIETIHRKTASLFKASTQCGAIAGGAKSIEIDALSVFGENFGLAYQIRDDLLDIIPREDVLPQDIKIFRATLPIVHLCKSVKPEEKKDLLEAITEISCQNSRDKRNTINLFHEHLERAGSIHYCADKINQYVTNAIASLESLKESPFKSYLIEMTKSLRFKY